MTVNFAKPFVSLEQTASATANGRVFGGQGFHDISVQVEGIVAGDIVQIEAKNRDEEAFIQIGSDITADGVYGVQAGSRYYRAIVSDNSGGGTVNAVFVGSD